MSLSFFCRSTPVCHLLFILLILELLEQNHMPISLYVLYDYFISATAAYTATISRPPSLPLSVLYSCFSENLWIKQLLHGQLWILSGFYISQTCLFLLHLHVRKHDYIMHYLDFHCAILQLSTIIFLLG